MTELMAYINATPGIDISDEVALHLPRRLVNLFGDRSYELLEIELLEDHSSEAHEKLCIITGRMSRLSDGVPAAFMKWCEASFGRFNPELLVSCILSCLRWSATWREQEYEASLSEFASAVLARMSTRVPREVLRAASWRLERCRRDLEGDERLKAGTIAISDRQLDIIMQQDSRSEFKIGFADYDKQRIRRVFAHCLMNQPLERLDRKLYRTSCELYSKHLLDRVPMDVEWEKKATSYNLVGTYWAGEQTERRRMYWAK